jgi:MarR family transcriptional regulator, organic hydroperoxide resistance regulator
LSNLSQQPRATLAFSPSRIGSSLSRAEVEEETLHTLTRVLARLHAPIRAALADSGMSLSHVTLMKILILKGEATASELAEELALTNGAVTQLLKKLEKEDLVTRERKDHDRRIVHVKLTEKARKRFSQLRTATLNELNEAFNGWAFSDIDRLRQLLAQLTN